MARYEYDLVIVGAGSGNSLPDERTEDWRVAIVESDRFGGTCLNRGCIPSKMFVHTADVARTITSADRFGIDSRLEGVDWPAIRDRVFARIDPLHDQAVQYRRANGVDVYLGEARFVAPGVLRVGDDDLHSARFVLAVGSRPRLPLIPGLDDVPAHTSDTIMRLERLPDSMLVIGGGFIAAEMSHVFGSLGTTITIVNRGEHLLSHHDEEVQRRFTAAYELRFDVLHAARVERLVPSGDGALATVRTATGEHREIASDVVLVATGRRPNSDLLDVAAAGIEADEHGHVITDAAFRTTARGVWAMGDLANHYQLKHLANAEARVVRHNVVHPELPRELPIPLVPAAVFAEPQVAAVGATEQELRAEGRPHLVALREYADTAYGWALEDTTGFVKLLADPESRLLLGAHILGPEASILVQPLIQAMTFGTTVDQLARQVLYIHPALTEVVEQALLEL